MWYLDEPLRAAQETAKAYGPSQVPPPEPTAAMNCDAHSPSAEFTPAMTSFINTTPSPFASKSGHASSDSSPRKRFTPLISSSTVTVPSALQSPTQLGGTGVAVLAGLTVGLWVAVALGAPVAVALAVAVGLAVGDSEGVGVRVTA